MQTIVSQLEKPFRAAIAAAFGVDADPLLGAAQNEKFGDYQSNAAMGLAKLLTEKTGQKTNPRAVAEQIKAKLELGGMASEVSIAGPGFINVRLAPEWLAGQLESIAADERLGIEKTSAAQTVVVDYSGPNVAKQMHVGHLRSTIIGDAISRVIEFQGHRVIRQNHIGDWGTQFGKVVLAIWYSVMMRGASLDEVLDAQLLDWNNASKLKDDIAKARIVGEFAGFDQQFIHEDPDGTRFSAGLDALDLDLTQLEGQYQFAGGVTDFPSAQFHWIFHPRHDWKTLEAIPRLTTTFIQRHTAEANIPERKAWEKARAVTILTCDQIYGRLNVQLGKPELQSEPMERGESFYNEFLPDVVAQMKARGAAAESDGAVVVFTKGFENPLIIQKSDGGFLYGTTDLAAIRYRTQTLHANRIIYTHDSRQAQHFAQVFDAARRAGWADGVSLEYAPFGTMLGEDNKPFKSRSGDTIKLKDLLDEAEERAMAVVTEKNPDAPESQRRQIAHSVGIGAVKYSDLSKDRTSDYVFSWEKMLSFDGNTAPYLQYAYARISSIFRKGGGSAALPAALTPQLQTPFEQSLAKHVLRFQEVVNLVSRELKPHYLCTYLYELAGKFSSFYENCDVLKSPEPTRSSRLVLIDITRRTLGQGLELLGIEQPEQM
ncbi:MAG TPA: arginine--tRNA ligase [Tepidisphaeraceae bacterium]|nr:arginine--tRNA ligase [Tepidisphaeraceae bacterium]